MNIRLLVAMTSALWCVAVPILAQNNTITGSNSYVFTKDHKLCFHTSRSYGPVDLCTDGELTTAEREQKAEAIQVRRAERAKQLKPDPRTPRFNECMKNYRPNDYYLVRTQCNLDLMADVHALSGWFSKGPEAEAADRSGSQRLATMKEISDEEVDEIRHERALRQLRHLWKTLSIRLTSRVCMRIRTTECVHVTNCRSSPSVAMLGRPTRPLICARESPDFRQRTP